FGGAILLYPRPPVRVEELPLRDIIFVVADSGIRHSVADIHPKRQADINRGLKILMESDEVPEELKKKLGYRFDEPRWEEIRLEEVEPYLKLMDEVAAKRIVYTLKVNESTMRAVHLIKHSEIKALGEIINEQHELMRDLYDLSLPELEKIRNSMLEAGALGVKISGAGLGGCLIAIAFEEKHAEKILDAALSSGAVRGWVLEVDEGVRLES
ncbi:MAG: GHMP kinase, partial [Thermoprotei archaeon]